MVVPVSVARSGAATLERVFLFSCFIRCILFLDCVSLPDWTQKYRLLAVIGRTSGGKLLGSYLPCWEGWRAKKPAP